MEPFSALAHQRRIFVEGAGGHRAAVPHGPEALRQAAKGAMSRDAWAYLEGAAGAESTAAANRADFARHRIVPRVMADVTEADMSVRLWDIDMPAPLMLAPMGVMGLVHREADLAVAEAARATGLPMIVSNQASVPMEAIAERLDGSPHLFQLYWSREEELVRSFVRRAQACGARGIVVTLDTKMLGWRPRDLDRAHLPFLSAQGIAQYVSDPVFQRLMAEVPDDPDAAKPRLGPKTPRTLLTMLRAHPGSWRDNLRTQAPIRAARLFTQIYSNPSLGRDHIRRLRAMTDLPIVLKGILHPHEARCAAEEGLDGVIVSNHGGRQVDGAVSSIAALPAIAEAVEGRLPVVLDSGVRCGADAFKALALGATAVGIGRPWGYGLALAGASGVEEVMRGLASDFELTMRLSGHRSVGEIGREALVEVGFPGAVPAQMRTHWSVGTAEE